MPLNIISITTTLKTITTVAITFILLIACRSQNRQHLSVKAINDSVVTLTRHFQDTSKFEEAISLLDDAIKIDSNYYDSYAKKLFFETSLGDFKNASITSSRIIKFKPDSADLYFQRGFFKELTNDTISSKQDFGKAALLYKLALDTMNKRNPFWFTYWKYSAICLIMIGQDQIIRDFLKQNCTTALDSSIYDAKVLTKSRQELLMTIREKYMH